MELSTSGNCRADRRACADHVDDAILLFDLDAKPAEIKNKSMSPHHHEFKAQVAKAIRTVRMEVAVLEDDRKSP